MKIHEYGKENEKTVLLLHPSVVMWDYFEYVIPFMEKRYHLLIPALPGYDPEDPTDFTSIEEIAGELENALISRGLMRVDAVYGCSMGGSVVAKLLANNVLTIQSAIMDGGIAPYRLPRLFTRFVVVKDFLLILIGKLGGIKVLEKVFSTDEFSKEDLVYAEGVLKK